MTLLLSTASFSQAAVQQPSQTMPTIIQGQMTHQPGAVNVPVPLPPESTTQSVQKALDDAERRIERVEDRLNFVLGAIVFLTAILAALPVFQALFNNKGPESRAKEWHELSLLGERAAQSRAEQLHVGFFEESQKTLSLVNQTLQLSKEASERAANVIQDRAKANLKELDQKAERLVTEAKDDTELVSSSHKRSELTALAQKINGFEINSLLFSEALPLTPHCEFIKGIDLHLKQQFNEAFEAWNRVGAKALDFDNGLRGLAYYWIGVERNNLGEFDKAVTSFELAEAAETGPRRYELRRIRLESISFNPNNSARTSIAAMKSLRDELQPLSADPLIGKTYARTCTTLGNIYLQSGMEENKDGDTQAAMKHYQEAKGMFEEVHANNQWALFGLAQSLFYLGDRQGAAKIFGGEARKNAQNQYLNRAEPRAKVLARTTELICCAMTPVLKSEVHSAYNNVLEALGSVDDRLTIYSQFQKRNLTKERFVEELRDFEQECFPRTSSA